MSEIALRTTERKLQTAKCLSWRPIGSTMICCSNSLIRRKWLEMCCDLVSPKKRDKFKGIPGWRRLCDAWTPQLREAWLHYDQPTEQYKIGRLLMDKSYPQVVWKDMIESIGVLKDLPFAPETDVKVYDTWLWSEYERRNYFIVVNEDASNDEVESWQGVENRDADTGEVLPNLAPDESYDPAINLAIVWKKQIKYKTDLGLSGDTLTDIADPEKVLHPRFDKPVEQTKIIRPGIEDSRKVIS